ncbi:MAG: hypothetical protein EOO04_12720 [Chitinophagaceae bacterium]|nr:MAG: hypothetical protein EOO04_12720 [Chitinophagaceae bacterium]
MKKAILSLAMSLFFVVSLNLTAAANDDDKKTSAIEVKVISTDSEQPIFQLDLNNKEVEEFYVTIKDNYGNTLYADKIKGSNISKKFKITSDGLADQSIRIEVRSKKTNKSEVYTINRSSKYVQETVVSKL